MNKKGFTLIELLAVIVIIALISSITYAGVMAVTKSINADLWESNILLIETSAVTYGEDYKYVLTLDKTCSVDGVDKTYCIAISVDYLIQRGYLKAKNTDDEGNKIFVNDTLEEDDEGYIVNDTYVCIYLDNNNVYSVYEGCEKITTE